MTLLGCVYGGGPDTPSSEYDILQFLFSRAQELKYGKISTRIGAVATNGVKHRVVVRMDDKETRVLVGVVVARRKLKPGVASA